jgi:uncharacterized protein with HEPN domain
MSNKALRVPDYIEHMLAAIRRIRRYCESRSFADFHSDEQLQDAVVRNIEIIGEAARNIATQAPDFSANHPEIPWAALYAMRNRVAHGYWSVDTAVVWQVIERDLPALEVQISGLVN